MGTLSLNEFLPLINRQIDLQEALNEKILKVKALVDLALSNDFLDYSNETIEYYLWAMKDMVELSEKLSKESLTLLTKQIYPSISITRPIIFNEKK